MTILNAAHIYDNNIIINMTIACSDVNIVIDMIILNAAHVYDNNIIINMTILNAAHIYNNNIIINMTILNNNIIKMTILNAAHIYDNILSTCYYLIKCYALLILISLIYQCYLQRRKYY